MLVNDNISIKLSVINKLFFVPSFSTTPFPSRLYSLEVTLEVTIFNS